MTGTLPPDQGRALHLYDEQLQRQQQEKLLGRGREAAGEKTLFFSRAEDTRPA